MQVTVNIPDNEISFFRELLKKFRYQEIAPKEDDSLSFEQEEFLKDIKEGLTDIKLHESGQKKLKTAKELWNEL